MKRFLLMAVAVVAMVLTSCGKPKTAEQDAIPSYGAGVTQTETQPKDKEGVKREGGVRSLNDVFQQCIRTTRRIQDFFQSHVGYVETNGLFAASTHDYFERQVGKREDVQRKIMEGGHYTHYREYLRDLREIMQAYSYKMFSDQFTTKSKEEYIKELESTRKKLEKMASQPDIDTQTKTQVETRLQQIDVFQTRLRELDALGAVVRPDYVAAMDRYNETLKELIALVFVRQ